MVPGFSQLQLPKEMLDVQEGKLEQWRTAMDSMTKRELEDPDIITVDRIDDLNLLETKRLPRNAFKNFLPAEIIDRKKMGFGAPVSDWFKEDFGLEAESMILNSPLCKSGLIRADAIKNAFTEHRAGRFDSALHLWVILNMTAWHDHWIGGHAA